MKLEPIEQLAIAMHSNPGAYALLIGSGVSSGAGLFTGWQITLDLVKQVAVAKLKGEQPDDPEKWYVENFCKKPDYSEVLDALGGTQAERNRLLRGYFEPSEEERERGVKVPGAAHRAITRLVKGGHVRVIITTNFDRLMEQALEAEGVAAQVISTDDALKGALPYIHHPCTVLKVHGDYLDIRIKNTAGELAEYSNEMNAYLDRILDEFGLIVCGWSAAWDAALRGAIYRCLSRRFTTFWSAWHGQLDEKAKDLVNHRRAQVIPIEGADQFFSGLADRVEALDRSRGPHPSSVEQAVGLVKLYLSEPKHRIQLHYLMREELGRVRERLPRQGPPAAPGSKAFVDHLRERVREYEGLTGTLLAMQVVLASHDLEERYADLVTEAVEVLGKPDSSRERYPALLLAYGVGLASILSRHYGYTAAALLKPEWAQWRGEQSERTAMQRLSVQLVLEEARELPGRTAGERTPASNHLHDVLRGFLRPCVLEDEQYNITFDILEYLVGLTYADREGAQGKRFWGPHGRFAYQYPGLVSDRRPTPVDDFFERGLAQGDDWGLLRAGFFDGSAKRLTEVRSGYQREVLDHLHWW